MNSKDQKDNVTPSVCYYNMTWTIELSSPFSSILIYIPEIIFTYIKQKVSYFLRFCCIDLSLPDTNCHPCQQLHWQTHSSLSRDWTHLLGRVHPASYQSVPVDSWGPVSRAVSPWTFMNTNIHSIREEKEGVEAEEESLKLSVIQLAHLFTDTEDLYSIRHFFIVILYSSKFRKNSVGKDCMLGCSGHGFG